MLIIGSLTFTSLFEYSIYTKLFEFVIMVQGLLLSLVSPRISYSFFQDIKGLKGLLKSTILINILIAVFFLVIFYHFQGVILDYLSSGRIKSMDPIYWILFSVYVFVRVISDFFAMISEAINIPENLFKSVLFHAPISVVLQILFFNKLGIYGITVGVILSFILTSSWYIPFKVFPLLKQRFREV
jgi:hypothetical protein